MRVLKRGIDRLICGLCYPGVSGYVKDAFPSCLMKEIFTSVTSRAGTKRFVLNL